MSSAETDVIRENHNSAAFSPNAISKQEDGSLSELHGREKHQQHKNSVVHVTVSFAVRRLRKIANSDCPAAWNSKALLYTGRIFIKFYI